MNKQFEVEFLRYYRNPDTLLIRINDTIYRYFNVSPYIKKKFVARLKNNRGAALAMLRSFDFDKLSLGDSYIK